MHLTRILAASRKIPAHYHNLPQKFIDRNSLFITKRAPRLPQYMQKIYRYKRAGYYDRWRPWEDEFQQLNSDGAKVNKIFVEPIRDWTYLRGDRVEVIKGPDKGAQGIINYIVKERNWVFVQGLNLTREFTNNQGEGHGNLICREEPYLINIEVKLVDPSDLMPTDVEWRYDDDGDKVRVSIRTGRIIPIPKQAYETRDYVNSSAYREQPKDTPAKLVTEVTFKPEAKTFEMDLCDQMDIKDDRIPYPMYWY